MISKVTTLSRPAILAEIFDLDNQLASQSSQGAREYFDVGLPMATPFSPTGTILVLFEKSLLHRNTERFLWGSIPDNGGIKYGFLPYLSKESYERVRLDLQTFSSILSALDALDINGVRQVLSRKSSEAFCRSIKHLVEDDVIEGMLTRPEEAARRIEFCLEGNLSVCESDVRVVLVPNTYRKILGQKNARLAKKKIAYYNPKNTVLEGLRRLEPRCDWRF